MLDSPHRARSGAKGLLWPIRLTMVSFVALCVLLAVGHLLRSRVKLLQKLYLPSCIVAGIVGLCVVQVAGISAMPESVRSLFARWSAVWSGLPGFLINIVFACLFLGVEIPKFSTLWRRAAPQLAYGQIVAWGQYVVAIAMWLLIIGLLFPSLPAMFAGILPVGFEGGHGTAAGLAPVFEHLGWPEGKDFALASATFGIVSAIIVGMILVNWAFRKGYVKSAGTPANIPEDDSISVIPVDARPSAGKLTVKSDVIESFTLHIIAVGLAIGIGYGIKALLLIIQSNVAVLAKHKLLSGFPLFPLCMLGGLIIQLLEERFDKARLLDLGLIRRIQNTSLDFLVVSAIATIRLDVVVAGLVPLLILVIVGIGWNVFCVMVLAKRMLPDNWFGRAIAELGQSMGVTATGLLLLRVVDPDYESPAADAFACKQLVHEPIMGGGLWTGIAIPLIAVAGPAKVLAIASAAVVFWLVAGYLMRRRTSRN